MSACRRWSIWSGGNSYLNRVGKPGVLPGCGLPNEPASSGFFSKLERKASPRGDGGTGTGAGGAAGCNVALA